ncbi:hypothetical protein SLEP1_g23912 [Rubroshorea leprosula]|uniref:Peptidase metallopeptidase domain-containing protein n=1 Tax=Rubroshorea leprosula TaxID=152421 RepID=A0AAV5JL66_9ROSI|nr:hypothetical protein SLEP1_g23912 [Rubroshorea leprosula]
MPLSTPCHLSLLLIIFLGRHLPPPCLAAMPAPESSVRQLTRITVNNSHDKKWQNINRFHNFRRSSAHSLHATKNFVYFRGKPRWVRHLPATLSYAFSPDHMIHYLTLQDIRKTFKRAFARWASVIPLNFIETHDYGFADIKIGFYRGDHGDGEPFDGVLGILAHSFSPEIGRLHLDAAETWAVDFDVEKSKVAIDLESVAVHEIGHLLGLAHSPVKEAVMYPSLKPREKKVDLAVDDIEGVQALYGSNPNFTMNSLLESDTSANEAVGNLRFESYRWTVLLGLVLAACLCM